MVIPGHGRSRHRYRGTLSAIERRMCTDQAEIEKGQTRNAFENQEESEKAIGYGISGSIQVSLMGG